MEWLLSNTLFLAILQNLSLQAPQLFVYILLLCKLLPSSPSTLPPWLFQSSLVKNLSVDR